MGENQDQDREAALPQADGPLMVELNQQDRAVDPVVEDAARFGLANPREPGAV